MVGKRILSIDYNSGGVHPKSAHYARCSSRLNLLGGLQLPYCAFDGQVYPPAVDYQKCFVWGPTTAHASTSINVKIIDLSFADPRRLAHSSDRFGNTRMRQSTARQYPFWFNQGLCACSLHDERFCVHPPSLSGLAQANGVMQAAFSSDKDKSYWPWKRPTSTLPQNPMGLTYADPSPERKAALGRVEEWLRERLKGMQGAGMSDWHIMDAWLECPWTGYGQLHRPEGWRDPKQLSETESSWKLVATKSQGGWNWTPWSR